MPVFVVLLVVGLIVSPALAGYSFGPASDDFTYMGSSPTKWEPGTNTASVHGFSPPAGPTTAGGATFSIMGAGFSDVSGADTGHGGNTG